MTKHATQGIPASSLACGWFELNTDTDAGVEMLKVGSATVVSAIFPTDVAGSTLVARCPVGGSLRSKSSCSVRAPLCG